MIAIELATTVTKSSFQIWKHDDQVWINTDGELVFSNPTTTSRPSSVFVQLVVNGFTRGYIFVPYPSISDDGTPLDGVAFAVRLWTTQAFVEHASIMWSDFSTNIPQPKHFSVRALSFTGVGTPRRRHHQPIAPLSMLGPHTYIHSTPGIKIPAPLELLFCFTHGIIDERWVSINLAQAVRLICCKKSISSVPRSKLMNIVSFIFARPNRLTIATTTTTGSGKKGMSRAFQPLDEIRNTPPVDTSAVMLVAFHALMTLVDPSFVAATSEVRTFRKRIISELGMPAGGLSKNEIVVVFLPQSGSNATTLPIFEPDTPDYTEMSDKMKPYVLPFKPFPVPSVPVILSEQGIVNPAPEHSAPPFLLRMPRPPPSAAPYFQSPPSIFFRGAAHADESEIREHALSAKLIVSFEDDLIIVGEKQINPFWL